MNWLGWVLGILGFAAAGVFLFAKAVWMKAAFGMFTVIVLALIALGNLGKLED